MERKMYFKIPTQVFFYETDKYIAGIAYHDEIICGCCGGIYSIEEIYEWADENKLTNPIVELSWVNLCDEIQGDLSPESIVPIFAISEDEFENVDWEKLSEDIFN